MSAAETDTDELPVKKGTMTKDPFHMTDAERVVWKINLRQQIRERLFAIGQPLIYKKHDQFIAEYADGSVKVL